MYIRPYRRRRSHPLRVLLLLLLIIILGFYFYVLTTAEEPSNPLLPTPTPTRSALSYRTEAEGFYVEGNLAQAITAYQQAVALEPQNAALYVPLARLLTLEGRAEEAIVAAQEATRLAPEYAPAWAVLGMAYDWSGQVDLALDACRRAVDLDPTYAEGYAYLAEASADANLWREALQAAQTAVALDAHSVDAQRDYGYVLELRGDYTGAVAQYRQALEIHPNLAYIYVDLGRNYLALSDTASAIQALKRAVELDPNRAEALDQLGWTYFNIEEYGQAQDYLEQAVAADPEYAPAYGHLALTFWVRRNYESALPNFETAIELAYRASRRAARGFSVTVEPTGYEGTAPSPDVVLRGDLTWADADRTRLTAALAPVTPAGQWANATGHLTLDVVSGEVRLSLQGLPPLPAGQVYVGWFDGLKRLNGFPLNTGPLTPADGSVETSFLAEPVSGPRIEHLYTLGLCYFYMARCELAYPLFDAALQIDPQEVNALEGIRLCQEAEGTPVPPRTPQAP